MSSTIKVQRVCEYCGNDFEARKTTSKTCSDHCAKMNYKAKQRAAKIEASNKETQAIKQRPLQELRGKEFLTIDEVCKTLSVSRWTVWRAIKNKEIKAGQIGRRKIIKRSEIDKLLN